MGIALAVIGLTSMIGQVVLMRELIATFYGNELVFGLILAAWLLWGAAGSAGLGRLAEGRKLGPGTFAIGLALAALFLPAQIALTRAIRVLLDITPGALVSFGSMAWSVLIILAPLCLLLGWQFTLGSRLLVGRGGAVGRAYVYEGWGAALGGALFSFLLVRFLNPFQIALGLGTVNLAVGWWLLRQVRRKFKQAGLPRPASGGPSAAPFDPSTGLRTGFAQDKLRMGMGAASAEKPEKSDGLGSASAEKENSCDIQVTNSSYIRRGWVLAAGLVALLLALLAWPLGQTLHRTTLAWQWEDALLARDTIYGRLTVVGRDGQRVFFENGLLMFETQSTFPEEVAHFPLLEHPAPRSVLLIGGGAGGDLREILKHPVSEVHYVELDPAVIEAARRHLPPEDGAVLDDPRVTLAHTDGRLYVKEVDCRFDVVVVDLPEPSTGQLNRFYTQEFFAEVKAILNEGGVFSFGLPSAENYLNPELRHLGGNVYQTLGSVFGQIIVLPGDYNRFIASDAPLTTDHTLLAKRLAERGLKTRWVSAPYLKYIFTTDRFPQIRRELEGEESAKLNRDLEPICYYYDMALWLSQFYSGLSGFFHQASLLSLWWVVVPLALAVVVLRWKRGGTVPMVMAFTGFAEMTVEMVVLLAFQALHGYVYYEVSLIVAAFMVGAALGGGVMNRLIAAMRTPDAAGSSALGKGRGWARRPLRVLIMAQGVAMLYALFLPSALLKATALPLPNLSFPLITLLAGFLGGMDFPLAAELTRGSVGRVAGLIYGADLVGACLGAFLSSALLIPVLGIPQTCYTVALLSLAGVMLLV
jgi:spermidine synthase